MTDTIRVYDKALSDAWCENLIEMFEFKSDEHHSLRNQNFCPKFTELCVNRASPAHVGGLVQFVLKVYDKYKADIGLRYIPEFTQLEEFRIKRYLVGNGDRFDEHVDIQRERTAKRAVSFLFYSFSPLLNFFICFKFLSSFNYILFFFSFFHNNNSI